MQKTILSTIDVARLFNVTETTVKRWADEGTLRCQKTPGGHRKFPVRDVVEFAERNNYDPVGVLSPQTKGGRNDMIQIAVLHRDFPALAEMFVEKALSPDRMDLYLFFSYLYEHRFPLWEIYDNVLRPGMTKIGDLWEHGDIGVNHEHRASYETLDALARLQAEVFIKPRNGKSVVLACMEEELHEIGLRSAAYVFEAEGWSTHYIGARTPAAAVTQALKDFAPSVLALSLTCTADSRRLIVDLQRVQQEAHAMKVPVIMGGAGISPEVRQQTPPDALLSSARDILDFTARLLSSGPDSGKRST